MFSKFIFANTSADVWHRFRFSNLAQTHTETAPKSTVGNGKGVSALQSICREAL